MVYSKHHSIIALAGLNVKLPQELFLADADDGSGNAVIHVLDGTIAWDTDDISLGANTGSRIKQKVIYHIADGNVTSV